MQQPIVSSRRLQRLNRARALIVASAAALSATACSDSSNTEPLVATTIALGAGSNAQTGVVGQPLAAPISVVVTDQNGSPIANAIVSWTVESVGGTLSAATSSTDATGTAHR